MAKKRSCRRTVNEDKVHEKAVKIRKMTDEQLVQYVNDRVEKARSEGFNQGKKSATGMTVNDFLKEISKIKGVGDATLFACLEIIYRFQNRKNINGFSNTFHNLINRLVCHRCLIYGFL